MVGSNPTSYLFLAILGLRNSAKGKLYILLIYLTQQTKIILNIAYVFKSVNARVVCFKDSRILFLYLVDCSSSKWMVWCHTI